MTAEAPAAFRRLCVETVREWVEQAIDLPAAFRRLCVETLICCLNKLRLQSSRLQAAVC